MKAKFRSFFKIEKTCTIIAAISALIICCFTLTACDPGHVYLKREDLADVAKIELINYDNPEQHHFSSWVPDHTSDLKPFYDSKLSVLKVLDEDKIPLFIDALCEQRILGTYFAYDSPGGICIKLTYYSGDFMIINCKLPSFSGYIGKFSQSGGVSEFIGCFSSASSFNVLINDFFQTEANEY